MKRLHGSFGFCSIIALAACGCSGDFDAGGPLGEQSEALSSGFSSDPPYLVPIMAGVSFKALLSAGDSPSKAIYPMVGIPDGLGAYSGPNSSSFILLMNHELRNTSGVVRAHGAKGAFVSKWRIDKATGKVLTGEDLISTVVTWNPATSAYNEPAQGISFNRFCSADLPAVSAFYDSSSGLGYDDRLYMNGEETDGGRAMAHDVETGISYQLPRLGKQAWENIVARPEAGPKTTVIGLDDSTPGEVYIYAGEKTASGTPIDQAGLTNGTLYGFQAAGFPTESSSGIPSGTAFAAYNFGDVSNWSGTDLQTAVSANAVTGFNRPEDGAWNPTNNNQFYFVTTASFTGSCRLWRLNFADAANPAAGGTIDLLVDGATTTVDGIMPKMFDNITVTNDGRYVYLQEDPGNQVHIAKIWRYEIGTGVLQLVAQHDPARFDPTSPTFVTQDEESSGIIDASALLGPGKFLLDVQVHKSNPDPALVEYGQLLVMTAP